MPEGFIQNTPSKTTSQPPPSKTYDTSMTLHFPSTMDESCPAAKAFICNPLNGLGD